MLFFADAMIRPGADLEPHVEEELAGVGKLREDGFIVQLLRRLDETGAYLLVEAESLEHAQERLDALPLPSRGLMDMRVEPVERL